MRFLSLSLFPLCHFSRLHLNPMPSDCSPPFKAVENPSSPSYIDLNDDSPSEYEILLCLCKKTLEDSEIVAQSMKSCNSDCVLALNLWLFGDSISDFPDSEMVVAESDFLDSEMVVAGSDFNDYEFVVAGSDLPNSVLDESIIPETQLEFQGFAAENRGTWKRKASGGEGTTAMAELASAKAAKAAKDPKAYAECREEMLRILLPSYFKLVRSFPVYVILLLYVRLELVCVIVAGFMLLRLDFVLGLWLDFVLGLWLDYCWRLGLVH